MKEFIYNGQPSRVVFGPGTLSNLAREVDELGMRRVLVLSTPNQEQEAGEIAGPLAERLSGIYQKAQMHVPLNVVREALAEVHRLKADSIVTFGGGSTIGLGKAIALETGLPILAIPTTYAGSEMTPIYGITEGGLKRTGRDPRVFPRTVIYDPLLTASLPPSLSITSGINAIAHAAEGLYARDNNPISNLMAEEGIRALAKALPMIYRNGADVGARSLALYGAWLCGAVLGSVGVALHHKLCHTLGGSFNLPHAEVHTIVLPHAMAFNASAAPDAMAIISRAFGCGVDGSAATSLYDLAKNNGAPTTLREIGMSEADLDSAAEIAVSSPYWNPRAFGPEQRAEIRQLLQDAFDGAQP